MPHVTPPLSRIINQMNDSVTVIDNLVNADVFNASKQNIVQININYLEVMVNDPTLISSGTNLTPYQTAISSGQSWIATNTSTPAPGPSPAPAPTALYSVGGTLNGLAAGNSVVLNGGPAGIILLQANGAFTFPVPIEPGTAWSVTMYTPPANEQVNITNASGNMGSANVTNVGVVASVSAPAPAPSPSPSPSPGPSPTSTFNIGGTLYGLSAGSSVTLNGGAAGSVTISSNGSFTFPNALSTGATYNVTVASQPAGETCTITQGSGTVGYANVVNIGANCVVNAPAATYSVGGTLSGLTSGASISLNAGALGSITLTQNGTFVFPTPISAGTTYSISVSTPPNAETVSLSNASGTMGSANVTNVGVACSVVTYTIGGTMSNLKSGNVAVLRLNNLYSLTVSANGPFSFLQGLPSGTSYSVTTLTEPSGQVVALTNASGTVSGANVTAVGAACTNVYSLGGTLSGLNSGSSVVLNGGVFGNLSLSSNGAFTFPTMQPNGTAYSVSVSTQPTGESCFLTNASGTIGTSNVTNVGAACSASTSFSVGGTMSGLDAGSSVVLKLNGGDDLTVSANGSFTFTTKVGVGASYVVTVGTQPAGATCTLTNASGTIVSSNVTNLAASCADNSSAISTVAGMQALFTGGVQGIWVDGTDYASFEVNGVPLTEYTYTGGITSVLDRSGNNNSLSFVVQPNGGSLPAYGDKGLKGWSGGGSCLRGNIGGGSTGVVIIISLQLPAGGYYPVFASDVNSSNANTGYQLDYQEDLQAVRFSAGTGSTRVFVSIPYAKGQGAPVTMMARHDGANLYLQLDNGSAVSTPCGTISPGVAQMSFGSANDTAEDDIDYSTWLEIFYTKNTGLTSNECEAVVSYFATIQSVGSTAPAPVPPTVTMVTAAALPADTGTTKTFGPFMLDTANYGNSNNQGNPVGTNGTIALNANVWNPPSTVSWSQTVGAVIQGTGGAQSATFTWDFPYTQTGTDDVKTYPNLMIGQQSQGYTTTDSRYPVLVSNIATLTTVGTMFTSATSELTEFDSGYDIFFQTTTPIGYTPVGELLIISQYNFPGITSNVGPATVTLDGNEYYVRSLNVGWPLCSFYAVNQTNNVALNLMTFINYAFAQGYLSSTACQYLCMVELGVEYEFGAGTTTINNWNALLTTKS